MATPLRARGKLLGVLDIHHRSPNEFNPDDLRLIRTVADQLAGVIDKATLYAELQDALQKEQSIRVQLIQAEKLAAMGRLVASVAHELNNPLQAIQNALYLVKMEDNLAPQARGDLQVALDETTRMGNLIARLRETYRPKASEIFEQDSLNDLAVEVQKLIDTHLRHNDIQFELVADPDLPMVSMSRDQIKQVVLNLCLNAVESMPDGGKLTIRTKYQVDLNSVALEVCDTGAGIPSEIIPHIFEPFYTTKEKGTGLGLFISYEILQNHGGQIEVISDRQHGTIFRIALPVNRSES
jgi:signal transduction histidine kinase